MYYVMCESDCILTELDFETKVLEPERYIVSIPHGIFSRRQLEKTKGVIRVRTVDSFVRQIVPKGGMRCLKLVIR